MKISAVAPELRPFYRILRTTPVGSRLSRWLVRSATGLVPDAKPAPGVTMEKVTLQSGRRIRVYTPSNAQGGGALLWIHGGGMVIGSVAQDDRSCYDTAAALGIVVVSADYRLAPEHPAPTPLDDCSEAWEWLQSNAAARSIDASRVAVGGQSAGGGLAASLAQRLLDEGAAQPVAQWLFCPMLDDRTAADRQLDAVRHLLWNNRSNLVGWHSYLAVEPGSATVPAYSVPSRRTALSGLPPAWIGAGDIELFYAEDMAFAAALTAAGVDTVVDVVAGAPHAFESFGTPLGQAYLERARAWLRPFVSVTA